MKSFLSFFINFLFYNIFCQENAFSRYILVEVGKLTLAGVKSGSGKIYKIIKYRLEK